MHRCVSADKLARQILKAGTSDGPTKILTDRDPIDVEQLVLGAGV